MSIPEEVHEVSTGRAMASAMDCLLQQCNQVGILLSDFTVQLWNNRLVHGDYKYFTAFPEFTTMCNYIKTLSIRCYQKLFDLVCHSSFR